MVSGPIKVVPAATGRLAAVWATCWLLAAFVRVASSSSGAPALPDRYQAQIMLTRSADADDYLDLPLVEQAGVLNICDFW